MPADAAKSIGSDHVDPPSIVHLSSGFGLAPPGWVASQPRSGVRNAGAPLPFPSPFRIDVVHVAPESVVRQILRSAIGTPRKATSQPCDGSTKVGPSDSPATP